MSHPRIAVLLLAILASAAICESASVSSAVGKWFRGGDDSAVAFSTGKSLLNPSVLTGAPSAAFSRLTESLFGGSSAGSSKVSPSKKGEDLEAMKQYVEQSIVINATPDEVFRVASGFEDYCKWAGCNSITVNKKGAGGLGQLVTMKVGMFGRNLAYTLAYKYSRPRLMSWHAVSGSIRSLQGTYEFIPAGPSRTKVVYKLNVDPGFWVPMAVKQATTRVVASAALSGLKKFTESPSTLAKLRSGGVGRELTESEAEEDRKRVYMLRMALL